MMFPDSEHVQTHLIGKFDPRDQMADTVRISDLGALADQGLLARHQVGRRYFFTVPSDLSDRLQKL